MANSISARIARDRGVSGFFAFIAALPAIAGLAAVGYATYDWMTRDNWREDGGFLLLGLLALVALLIFIVARWTFDAARSALTPQRVQAMWLRRFQSERGGAFRTSRIIDRLSRFGVSALTLQDRDVQLSFEQRRNRLAPVFWLIFIPLTALIVYLVWTGSMDAIENLKNTERTANSVQEFIGNIMSSFVGIVAIFVVMILGLFFGVLISLVGTMLLAALSGPIGAVFSRNRDDFASLPSTLKRITNGKSRGASVVRISDAHWREAVCSSLAAVDVAIIDLSDVSDHVAWEIGEAVKACGANGLVFIARGETLSPAAKSAVKAVTGGEPRDVVFYPERHGGNGEAFARALRQRIYAAADAKAA